MVVGLGAFILLGWFQLVLTMLIYWALCHWVFLRRQEKCKAKTVVPPSYALGE